MVKIIKTEIIKLKRYSIIWVGFAAALLVVLLTRFMATAEDGAARNLENFSNTVIWNNFSLLFPATITLIAGYMISREYTEDTLKNILTIPLSFRRLLAGKLITAGLLALFLAVVTFVLSLTVVLISGFQTGSAAVMVKSLMQMMVMNLCIYLAVLPIIVLTSRNPNGFMAGVGFAFFYGFIGIFAGGHGLGDLSPITAGLGLIHYQAEGGSDYNVAACVITLLIMVIVSVLLIAGMGDRMKEARRTERKKGQTSDGKKKKQTSRR